MSRPTYAEEFENLRDNMSNVVFGDNVMETMSQLSSRMRRSKTGKNMLKGKKQLAWEKYQDKTEQSESESSSNSDQVKQKKNELEVPVDNPAPVLKQPPMVKMDKINKTKAFPVPKNNTEVI